MKRRDQPLFGRSLHARSSPASPAGSTYSYYIPRRMRRVNSVPECSSTSLRRQAGQLVEIFRSIFTGARATPIGCDLLLRRYWLNHQTKCWPTAMGR
jgi:hypothetical protein